MAELAIAWFRLRLLRSPLGADCAFRQHLAEGEEEAQEDAP